MKKKVIEVILAVVLTAAALILGYRYITQYVDDKISEAHDEWDSSYVNTSQLSEYVKESDLAGTEKVEITREKIGSYYLMGQDLDNSYYYDDYDVNVWIPFELIKIYYSDGTTEVHGYLDNIDIGSF